MRRGRLLILLALVLLAVVIVVVVLVVMRPATPQPPGGTPRPEGQRGTVTPIPYTFVVVSTQNLPRGFRIPRNAVDVVPWPVESGVQENAFVLPQSDFQDAYSRQSVTQAEKDKFLDPAFYPDTPVGKVVRTSIVRWQPILSSMVVPDLTNVDAEDVGSQTAALLPSGFTAISVPCDILSCIGYALADGDRVDVIMSFLFVDVDEEFQSRSPNFQSLVTVAEDGSVTVVAGVPGRLEPGSILGVPVIINPSEFQRPRLVAQRTIQNALVMHIGEYPLGGDFLKVGEQVQPTRAPQAAAGQQPAEGTPVPTAKPPRPSLVTLAVRPQEAVLLVWAIEHQIPLTLTLRSAADRLATADLTQPVSLEYVVANYQITRQARLEYTLEPRLTQVRSINNMLLDDGLIHFIDVTPEQFEMMLSGSR